MISVCLGFYSSRQPDISCDSGKVFYPPERGGRTGKIKTISVQGYVLLIKKQVMNEGIKQFALHYNPIYIGTGE